MKVKISTWKDQGVTRQDIENWAFQGLITRDYMEGRIWTVKAPSKWPAEAKARYYATAGKVARESAKRAAAWKAECKAEGAIEIWGCAPTANVERKAGKTRRANGEHAEIWGVAPTGKKGL